MVQETVLRVGLVALSVGGLWLGARLLVDAAVRLARRGGLSDLTIGLTIVAAGTSAPELVVTADAALAGLGDIAVGNIVGSNVYNLAFILGVVSLLRFVPVERSLVHRDGVVLLASTLLGGFVLLDLFVSRPEGGLLLGLFVAYTVYLLRDTDGAAPDSGSAETDDPRAEQAFATRLSELVTDRLGFAGRDVVVLVAGLAVVLGSGDLLVRTASTLARGAGVSDWVIGGTIVAAGTSTPEFAVSLVAVRRGRLGVSVGNVVGSNVFNLMAVLGVGALLRPLSFERAALGTMGWLVVLTAAMVAALWTGRQLSRSEGALFAGSEVVRWVIGLLG
jgi:cation:H+ antiporter